MTRWIWCVAVLLPLGIGSSVEAQQGGGDAATFEKTVQRGIDFLKTKGQAEDGSYSKNAGPGVTALVTTALLRHGRSPDDPQVAKSLKYLTSFFREDGAVAAEKS